MLDQHGVIDRRTECAFNCFQVWPVAIGCQLDAGCQPGGHVLHEVVGVFGVPVANRPRHHQLRVGVDRGPGPTIASIRRSGFGSPNVLGLAVDETPNFIALNPLGTDVLDRLVVERFAGRASIRQDFRHGVDRHIRHSSDGPHGRSLAKHGEDLDALGVRELVSV